jgi:hypothetical protein
MFLMSTLRTIRNGIGSVLNRWVPASWDHPISPALLFEQRFRQKSSPADAACSGRDYGLFFHFLLITLRSSASISPQMIVSSSIPSLSS